MGVAGLLFTSLFFLVLGARASGAESASRVPAVTIEVVDSTGSVGMYSSVAVDEQDRLVVSYYDEDAADLKSATRQGVWQSEVVDSPGEVGAHTSLAIDPMGRRNIAYFDGTSGSLKYAGWLETYWASQIETVDGGVGSHDAGSFSSLALDEQDRLVVSYYDGESGDLRVATYDNTWQMETVDSPGDVGSHTSLSIDPTGRKNLTYHNDTNRSLKYSGWLDTFWTSQLEMVDGGVGSHDAGSYSSLATDELDRLLVSYYDALNGDLKVALKNGTWQTEAVDILGDVGSHTSLAVDPTGRSNLVYYNASNRSLKYTGWLESYWTAQIEPIDSGAGAHDAGSYSSLAIEESGELMVSYYDAYNGSLMFALQTEGSWYTEVVDDTANVGQYTSLAGDANGGRHISYYDATQTALKYAGSGSPTSSANFTDHPPRGHQEEPLACLAFHFEGENPIGSHAAFRVDVPPPGQRLRVLIYDMQGRLVNELLNGLVDPGSHSLAWDRTDWRGNQVGSGIYFARFSGKGVTTVRRIAVVH